MAMSIEIIWVKLPRLIIDEKEHKLIIRDVPLKWHDRIRQYMVEHFFRTYRLYKQLDWFSVPETEEHYELFVKHVLRDECSIMVIDEETNEIFGVALVKWMTKQWRSWTIFDLIVPRETFAEFNNMQRQQVLDYAQANPDHTFDSLHLFDFSVHHALKTLPGFMERFFYAICEVARHMGMPRVTYLARTNEEQALVDAVGWTELERIIYSLYIVHERRPFSCLRDLDEMYAVLYEKPLIPLTPFYYMLPPMPPDVEDELKHQPPRHMSLVLTQPSTFTMIQSMRHDQ